MKINYWSGKDPRDSGITPKSLFLKGIIGTTTQGDSSIMYKRVSVEGLYKMLEQIPETKIWEFSPIYLSLKVDIVN